jgi:predicted metal-dependent hydrolase
MGKLLDERNAVVQLAADAGPENIARYLVAHELAHRAHPDHSRRFWEKVAELCPGFRDEERWLKKNGVGLVL